MNPTAPDTGGFGPVEHLGPGVHGLTDVDPVKLAARLGALLITSDEAVDELVARTDHAPIAQHQLDALAALVGQAEAADRIAARARTHATTAVRDQAAALPTAERDTWASACRDAAVRVRAARDGLEAATAALDAAPHTGAARLDQDHTVDDETLAADQALFGPAEDLFLGSDRTRSLQLRAYGSIGAAVAIGLLLVALGVLPLWLALLPALIICLVLLWVLRDKGDEARAHLAAHHAGGGPKAPRRLPEPVVRRELAEKAEQQLRAAEDAWHVLAGPDADPADVEAIIKDSAWADKESARAAGSATVQATTAFADRLRQQWVDSWTRLDLPAPETIDQKAVAELAAEVTQVIVVTAPAAHRAHAIIAVRPAAPVVVVS
jgi:hypothetical protein